MVESKLVELVVAGSNPVGHPTSNLVIWPCCNFAPRNLVPDALVDVIQENLREQFHAADVERPLQFPRDKKSDDERVNTAGDAPRNRLGETAIMFFGHAGKYEIPARN